MPAQALAQQGLAASDKGNIATSIFNCWLKHRRLNWNHDDARACSQKVGTGFCEKTRDNNKLERIYDSIKCKCAVNICFVAFPDGEPRTLRLEMLYIRHVLVGKKKAAPPAAFVPLSPIF